MPMPRWDKILVHHSAGKDTRELQYDDIERYHERVRGWADIGYHRVVERVEDAYVTIYARPLWRPGAHCPGQNSKAIGWCLVGDFTKDSPPGDQLIEAARGIAEMILVLGLDHDIAKTVQPHRAFKATQCPGNSFPMDRLHRLIAALLAAAK